MLQKDISGQAHAPVRVRELLAHRIADGLGVPPAALFRGQFRLCDAPLSPIEGWCSLALGARYLHACPDLRQYRILDLDGRLAGVVLGVALDPDAGPGGAPLASVTQLDCRLDAPDMADRVEALIARLVGRFIALCCVPGAARAYTDAAGDMGLLHDPGTGILGSSLPVILAREVEELPDFNHRAVLDGLGGYTLGYTRDRRVERLLPNHRLDLATMRATRFWPREDSLAAHEGIGIDAAAGAIIARLAQNVAGFQAIAPCLMPISGGQDSRILLGAAREHHARMAGFFGWHMHRQSRRDTATGARIAERLGLDYTIIARIEATIDEVAAFYARTGQLATGTAFGKARRYRTDRSQCSFTTKIFSIRWNMTSFCSKTTFTAYTHADGRTIT